MFGLLLAVCFSHIWLGICTKMTSTENRVRLATFKRKTNWAFARSISDNNGNKVALRLSDENRMRTHFIYQHLQIDSCVLSTHCGRVCCIKCKTKRWKVCCTVVVLALTSDRWNKGQSTIWLRESKECQCHLSIAQVHFSAQRQRRRERKLGKIMKWFSSSEIKTIRLENMFILKCIRIS